MNVLVINGPNLNMLGMRDSVHYGTISYNELKDYIEKYAVEKGIEVSFFQSNHEGDIVDKIQQAYGNADGIIINPAAYTHTSVAILDALKAVKIPDSVTSIGSYAFYECTGLTSITIPDSVTSIGDDAFYYTGYYNNSSNWENGVLYIGNHLIAAKTDITSCKIKNGTVCIGDYAFYGCTKLESLSLNQERFSQPL